MLIHFIQIDGLFMPKDCLKTALETKKILRSQEKTWDTNFEQLSVLDYKISGKILT